MYNPRYLIKRHIKIHDVCLTDTINKFPSDSQLFECLLKRKVKEAQHNRSSRLTSDSREDGFENSDVLISNKRLHTVPDSDESEDKSKNIFKCSKCGVIFKTSIMLSNHEKSHKVVKTSEKQSDDMKPFVCNYCEKGKVDEKINKTIKLFCFLFKASNNLAH